MIRRLAVAFAIVSATVATAFVGCGGSTAKGSGGGGGGTDAGPGETSTPVEASTSDAAQHKEGSTGGDDGGGGTLPDGSVAPHGTQLVTSEYSALMGVTSDGYAIYTDTSAVTLNAVSLAGGAPSIIGGVDGGVSGSGGVYVAGATALAFDGVDPNTGFGTLSSWTSSKGLHTVTTGAYPAQVGSGELDSQQRRRSRTRVRQHPDLDGRHLGGRHRRHQPQDARCRG